MLPTVKSAITSNTALYNAEIEQRRGKIAHQRIENEAWLSERRREQITIIKELRGRQNAEVDELRQRLDVAIRQQRVFREHHGGVVRVKESELTSHRNQLERQKSINRDPAFAEKLSAQEGKMEQQQREAEPKAQIEIVDAEINEIGASRNEDVQRARLQVDETDGSFETHELEQKAKIDRYTHEIAKR
jgi:hypothetical protein